jgi:hypothetical protein
MEGNWVFPEQAEGIRNVKLCRFQSADVRCVRLTRPKVRPRRRQAPLPW